MQSYPHGHVAALHTKGQLAQPRSIPPRPQCTGARGGPAGRAIRTMRSAHATWHPRGRGGRRPRLPALGVAAVGGGA